MPELNKRQRKLLEALSSLGGHASTKEIADKAGEYSVNGVSRTLGRLGSKYVTRIDKGRSVVVWDLLDRWNFTRG